MNGFINLLKPPGMSSAAAVGFIKRRAGGKVGHAGTLDPEACGVLPVMLGRATRLLPYFEDRSKEYIAQICFSCATDTQDAQGKCIEMGKGMPSLPALEEALAAFTGDILQCPPAYSALKRDGQPLYALARRGEMVETEPRPARIDRIELLDISGPDTALLRVCCGEGTYIRTLCHDIGQHLGYPSHMRLLIRSRSGCFRLDESHTLEEIARAFDEGAAEKLISPPDMPVMGFKALALRGKALKKALNGVRQPLPAGAGEEGQLFRLYGQSEFIGIGRAEQGELTLPLPLTDQVDFLARHPEGL